MDIVNKKRDFGSLDCGEVFTLFDNGSYFMKAEIVEDTEKLVGWNAVELTTGSRQFFYPDAKVIRLSCKLVIE